LLGKVPQRKDRKGIEFELVANFGGFRVVKRRYAVVAKEKFSVGSVAVPESLKNELDVRYAEFVRSIRIK
jgi:hypothetical protein